MTDEDEDEEEGADKKLRRFKRVPSYTSYIGIGQFKNS